MSNKPDPNKAIIVKPGKRTVGKRTSRNVSAWQEHASDVAKYDEWGIALRAVKENQNVR